MTEILRVQKLPDAKAPILVVANGLIKAERWFRAVTDFQYGAFSRQFRFVKADGGGLEARGYSGAWYVLLDEPSKPVEFHLRLIESFGALAKWTPP